jgi:hypothetical protein
VRDGETAPAGKVRFTAAEMIPSTGSGKGWTGSEDEHGLVDSDLGMPGLDSDGVNLSR